MPTSDHSPLVSRDGDLIRRAVQGVEKTRRAMERQATSMMKLSLSQVTIVSVLFGSSLVCGCSGGDGTGSTSSTSSTCPDTGSSGGSSSGGSPSGGSSSGGSPSGGSSSGGSSSGGSSSGGSSSGAPDGDGFGEGLAPLATPCGQTTSSSGSSSSSSSSGSTSSSSSGGSSSGSGGAQTCKVASDCPQGYSCFGDAPLKDGTLLNGKCRPR